MQHSLYLNRALGLPWHWHRCALCSPTCPPACVNALLACHALALVRPVFCTTRVTTSALAMYCAQLYFVRQANPRKDCDTCQFMYMVRHRFSTVGHMHSTICKLCITAYRLVCTSRQWCKPTHNYGPCRHVLMPSVCINIATGLHLCVPMQTCT